MTTTAVSHSASSNDPVCIGAWFWSPPSEPSLVDQDLELGTAVHVASGSRIKESMPKVSISTANSMPAENHIANASSKSKAALLRRSPTV